MLHICHHNVAYMSRVEYMMCIHTNTIPGYLFVTPTKCSYQAIGKAEIQSGKPSQE